jgi:hypothetical protein
LNSRLSGIKGVDKVSFFLSQGVFILLLKQDLDSLLLDLLHLHQVELLTLLNGS